MKIPAFVRQHVRGDGTPKDSYATEERATKSASGCLPQQYAYQCSLCSQWHLAAGDGKHRGVAPKIPWYGDA